MQQDTIDKFSALCEALREHAMETPRDSELFKAASELYLALENETVQNSADT